MRKGEIVERHGDMRDMDRSFDVDFCQAQGPEAIFDAAWDMVVEAWRWKLDTLRISTFGWRPVR
ncbi:MAG: hypothetical protein SFV18_21885 [Bryobacteraceae bacterium]|nr:hypothetical protein [Bryobacteraceae bacterium]